MEIMRSFLIYLYLSITLGTQLLNKRFQTIQRIVRQNGIGQSRVIVFTLLSQPCLAYLLMGHAMSSNKYRSSLKSNSTII